MTGAVDKNDVLRVALPSACNTQQNGQNDATGRATTTQHSSLKALAQLALTCNNACDTSLERFPEITQQTECFDGALVALGSGALRERLLALAAANSIEPELVLRLPAADLAACDGLPDDVLRVYVLALGDTASRHSGRVPLDDTAAIYCAHCGPVWIHPDIAAVLPVVDGWPRALGCPWCVVRKAGGYIPRPSIACGDCKHLNRDAINPAAGTCASGHGTRYPMAAHCCGDFQPDKE